MSKKSFKDNNPALAFLSPEVQDTQEVQEVQEVYGTQTVQSNPNTQSAPDVDNEQKKKNSLDIEAVKKEKEKYIKHPTQGRKGKKLPRINMAFSNQNLEYLQIISRIEGISMTQYVNNLIEKDREKRSDLIEKAKTILK